MTLNIFLDLDGTLTNPELGITRSVALALKQLGHPVPPLEDLRWVIGPALLDSFAQMGVGDPHKALAIYRDRYTDVGLFENAVYPGIPEALAKLKSQGHRLYLMTAKPHAYACRITAHFGLSDYFSQQFGPELDGTRNKKGELLQYALKIIGIQPGDSVMVGDRIQDFDAAEFVGMRSVAVTWGFGTDDELARADVQCTTPANLPDCLGHLANA